MSKGSGGTRATNSRTAHGGSANSGGANGNTGNGILSRGEKISDLDDFGIDSLASGTSSFYRPDSDKQMAQAEAIRRGEAQAQDYLNNIKDRAKDFKAAKKAFVDEYKGETDQEKLADNVFRAQYKQSHVNPERAKAFNEAKSQLNELVKKLKVSHMAKKYASLETKQKVKDVQKKLGILKFV